MNNFALNIKFIPAGVSATITSSSHAQLRPQCHRELRKT